MIVTQLIYVVTSFCNLAPMLIRNSGRYLLREVFIIAELLLGAGLKKDPVERYFSKQHHRGGRDENPTVELFQTNAAILM